MEERVVGACRLAWAHVGQMWGLCLRRAFLVGAGEQVRGGGAHDVFLPIPPSRAASRGRSGVLLGHVDEHWFMRAGGDGSTSELSSPQLQ